ncbi:helix-turn-helix transcriptional regulator [Bacillus luteus]|uniref:Helix-turn-helix transcriptional regulator n=2 Tax=Alkalicoccus luteus TaxID=1237094 RepID=A0A969TVY3_9BACI|nr:helix-turn-helix transcriptional regulator [Alkalicoccus luteus]
MAMIHTLVPPLPTYVKGGAGMFAKGTKHFARTFHLFDFLFVTKGTLYMKEAEQIFKLNPGDYLILVPGRHHAGYRLCEEDTSFYWAHFQLNAPYTVKQGEKPDWSQVYRKQATHQTPDEFQLRIGQSGTFLHPERAKAVFESLLAAEHSDDPEMRMHRQSRFFDCLIYLQKEAMELPSGAQEVARRTMAYIQDHYKIGVRIDELAQQLLYHPDYVTRSMKKVTGLTPKQYLHHVRLEKAKELLQNGSYHVAAVSEESGFKDVSYFSRLFKEREGMTPGQYRRLIGRSGL